MKSKKMTGNPTGKKAGKVPRLPAEQTNPEGEESTAEERVWTSESLYRAIFENTGAATIISEEDTTIALANSQFEKLTGYRKADLEGRKSWTDFVDKEDLGKMLAYHKARRIDPETAPRNYELKVISRTGKTRYIFITVGMIPGTNRSVLSFLDITKRKLAEEEVHALNEELDKRVTERTTQLEAANKELEAFSYSVSHDLRTPLLTIQGFSHILAKRCGESLDSKARKFLDAIQNSSKQMEQLITDLLALSHLEREELRKIVIDITQLVHNVFEELTLLEENRNLSFVVKDPPKAMGDPSMIHQVFVNLLSNAIKFTRKKENAHIEVGGIQDKGETIYYVKDNGAGFNMVDAGKLFQVFQRLHSKDDYEGTGVGLAIVQRIITRHGGRIWAEAKPGEGATFRFTLPANPP